MDYSVLDIETDGLIETATKIHCMSIGQYRGNQIKRFTLTTPESMRNFLDDEPIIVGHNLIRFDAPVSEKLLNYKIKSRQVDTLGLSWYLYPLRQKHGLEEWGEDLGIEKPKIADWSNLSIEEYIYRCESDREINIKLFDMQLAYLSELYEGNGEKINRLINYLSFKLDCAREQEEVKWRLDVDVCEKNLEFLKKEQEIKRTTLISIMPKHIVYKKKARPKEVYKKDGTPSVVGQRWLDLLKERSLPEHHIGTLLIPDKVEDGNPGSPDQLKKWLFDLGWVPDVYKYVKNKVTGEQRKIPQISKENEPELTDSVRELFEKAPGLEHLEGLFIVRHRIGILEGFLANRDENNFLKAEVKGLTNTLRFQHTTIVNLPTTPKPYWEQMRGCLIKPDDDHVLCGSDMSGLEDNTKRHYMYYYDPDYVNEMREYGFDAHCDMAVQAKKMSHDEQTFYKWYDAKKEGRDHQKILDIYYAKGYSAQKCIANSATNFALEELLTMSPEDQSKYIKILKPIRLKNKKVNFAGVYGAGAPKLAITASVVLFEAKSLHRAYWSRNWAVKKIAEDCIVKTIGAQMWLFNPVSQFWYTLRYDKDRFSTLNQGTGVYCFDIWIRNVRKQSIKICGQFHDEHIAPVKIDQKEEHAAKLRNAIDWTNQELQLNVPLGISIDFGDNYAEIH